MRHAADRDLILLVDGELDAPDEQALRRHLDACLVCREREAEIRESLAEFASLQSEIALPDAPAARAELRAAIRTQEKPRLAPLAPGLAACAALVLFAANHARGDLSKPRTALTPGEARAISVSDAAQTASETSGLSLTQHSGMPT
jgi:anti-sigma factor RsiW